MTHTTISLRASERWLGRLRYILERIMIRGSHDHLPLVAMAIALIALAGGVFVKPW